MPDPYASKIAGREKWDDERRAECDFLVCGSFEEKEYEWQSAYCPEIPKNEMVMYKLHVRGFSMDSGKKGKMRGTFAAVEERIPYLKALGVTTVELMPVYEFEEIEIPKKQKLPEYIPQGTLPSAILVRHLAAAQPQSTFSADRCAPVCIRSMCGGETGAVAQAPGKPGSDSLI